MSILKKAPHITTASCGGLVTTLLTHMHGAICIKSKYRNVVSGLLLILASVNASFASESYVASELDSVITFEEKTLYKIAPRLLVNQALESLPRTEKEVIFLCERNSGYIHGLSYSMLCYTSVESGEYINILGEVRYKEKLWNYETKLTKGNLANNLLVLIEALSRFTYNKIKNENTSVAGTDVQKDARTP